MCGEACSVSSMPVSSLIPLPPLGTSPAFPCFASPREFSSSSRNTAARWGTGRAPRVAARFAVPSFAVSALEATQSLKRNLKFELLVMPFFLLVLYYFTSGGYSLIYIGSIILAKETILLFLRLNILQKEINKLLNYYIYSILFICMLYLSLYNQNLFYLFEILMVLSLVKND